MTIVNVQNKCNYIPNGFTLFRRTSLIQLKIVEKECSLIFNYGIGAHFFP
jgi:hypothetical protein